MTRSPVQFLNFLRGTGMRRGAVFASILLGALLAFEVFNYSTTDYALTDLLGSQLTFMGIRWATILSVAFCGIDFAGIARLFTPEKGSDEPVEVWYLFGAWVLAAAMNATLTWWGVSLAVINHNTMSSAVIERATLIKVVPIFVALMVWVIRILIIGTFSMAGEHLFSQDDRRAKSQPQRPAHVVRPTTASVSSNPRPASYNNQQVTRPEPSYHPAGLAASSRDGQKQQQTRY